MKAKLLSSPKRADIEEEGLSALEAGQTAAHFEISTGTRTVITVPSPGREIEEKGSVYKPGPLAHVQDAQSAPSLAFVRSKPGPPSRMLAQNKRRFCHDGGFKTLLDVVNSYDERFNLGLSGQEKQDLVEYLKSL